MDSVYCCDTITEIVSVFWSKHIKATLAVIHYKYKNEWTIDEVLALGNHHISRTPVRGQPRHTLYVKTVLLRDLKAQTKPSLFIDYISKDFEQDQDCLAEL